MLPVRVFTAPYLRLTKRAIKGAASAIDVAFERETLCAAEKTDTQSAVFLPGQLDRVTSATEHQPLSAEIESMLATQYVHAPTYAYHIRDAVLTSGSIYAENLRYFVASSGSFQPTSEVRYFKLAGCASTSVGHRFFGHWLRDDCLKHILASNYATPLCVHLKMSPHMQEYARCFGQDWTGATHAVVDHLVLFQDHAQNSLKRLRYQQLSSRIADFFPVSPKRDKLVYIRRGASGLSRLIDDEDAMIEQLVRRGFEVLDVTSDLSTIVEVLRAAKLVVSIEGSNINHFNFCAGPNCALIVLQPPDRFTAFHRDWAECVGVRFGFVVGTKCDDRYAFSAIEILQTTDLMLKAIG